MRGTSYTNNVHILHQLIALSRPVTLLQSTLRYFTKEHRYSYPAMKLHLRIPAYLYLFATLQLRYPHNYQLSIHLLQGGDYYCWYQMYP